MEINYHGKTYLFTMELSCSTSSPSSTSTSFSALKSLRLLLPHGVLGRIINSFIFVNHPDAIIFQRQAHRRYMSTQLGVLMGMNRFQKCQICCYYKRQRDLYEKEMNKLLCKAANEDGHWFRSKVQKIFISCGGNNVLTGDLLNFWRGDVLMNEMFGEYKWWEWWQSSDHISRGKFVRLCFDNERIPRVVNGKLYEGSEGNT